MWNELSQGYFTMYQKKMEEFISLQRAKFFCILGWAILKQWDSKSNEDCSHIRLKKKRGLFLGPFFFKTDAAGRLFILIFIQQKTDAGAFL